MQVLFSGLTPGLIGVVQINIQLPATLPAGSTLPLVLNYGGAVSPAVNLNVVQRSAATANLALSLNPNPVPRGSDGKWTTSLTVRETGGVGVTVTKILIGGEDFTLLLGSLLGTNRLEANSSFTTSFAFTGYTPPADVVWQLTGNDDTGHNSLTWTSTVRLQ